MEQFAVLRAWRVHLQKGRLVPVNPRNWMGNQGGKVTGVQGPSYVVKAAAQMVAAPLQLTPGDHRAGVELNPRCSLLTAMTGRVPEGPIHDMLEPRQRAHEAGAMDEIGTLARSFL